MSLDFAPHPLRRQVLDELHARPFQLVETPRRVLLHAFATAEVPVVQERATLAAWCGATGAARPDEGANFHRAVFPTSRLRWERHS